MNVKNSAKHPQAATAALAVAVLLASAGAAGDDGNLTQQVRIEQSRSAFELELEQIEARARARSDAASTGVQWQPTPVDLGDSADSLRLAPIEPDGPDGNALSMGVSESARRLQAEQAHDRNQRFILDQRQQRRALRAQSPVERSNTIGSYARNRGERVRFQSQNKQQSFQRKLRP